MLVQHHLIRLLDEADKAGAIRGEIIVVPVANPIGSGQVVNSTLAGRHDVAGGAQFQPPLARSVRWGSRSASKESWATDAAANIAAVRRRLARPRRDERRARSCTRKRLALVRLAYDADFVFDLHCDSESLLHLYLNTVHWPDGADLSAEIGSRATMICDDSGAGSFDESFILPWLRLAKAVGPDIPDTSRLSRCDHRIPRPGRRRATNWPKPMRAPSSASSSAAG